MRTQVMHESTATTPWLEFCPTGSSRLERVSIESFPFTIGRIDTVDLPVQSTRVSREHAAIDRREGGFLVRDLGSTNGTFLNGSRIEEAALQDGDTLVIADVEMTFFTGQTQEAQRCVTQVMGGATQDTQPAGHGNSSRGSDLILELRRCQEILNQRAARCRFQRVFDLHSGDVFGYEVLTQGEDSQSLDNRVERILRATECRLTERMQELHRLLAAEEAARLERETHIFFNLQTAEVGAEWLPTSLQRLRAVMADHHKVVVEIPDSAVCDIPFFRSFLAKLRELRIGVAYDGFHSGESQVLDLEEIAPDFLKLSSTLVRGIGRSSGGQRQVQAIVRAAREIQSDVIATGVQNEDEVEIFRDLGCRFAQGDLYGSPTTVSSLATSGPLAVS